MKEVLKIPKYQIIENDLIDMINQGIIKTNDCLPSESELQSRYNCSRVTVRQALNNLTYKGFIYKKRGSGSYVSSDIGVSSKLGIKSFSEDMAALNKNVTSKILTFNVTQAGNTIASILGISKEDRIYYIERLRLADNIPLMFERTFISVDKHPNLSYGVMEGSKYTYARENHFEIDNAYQRINPIFPGDYIADALKISPKQPILRVNNIVYLKDGSVFDFDELYINTDYYQVDYIVKK